MGMAKNKPCRVCGSRIKVGGRCGPCTNIKDRARYADNIKKTQGRVVQAYGLLKLEGVGEKEFFYYTHKPRPPLPGTHGEWMEKNGIKIKVKLKKFDLNVFEDKDDDL